MVCVSTSLAIGRCGPEAWPHDTGGDTTKRRSRTMEHRECPRARRTTYDSIRPATGKSHFMDQCSTEQGPWAVRAHNEKRCLSQSRKPPPHHSHRLVSPTFPMHDFIGHRSRVLAGMAAWAPPSSQAGREPFTGQRQSLDHTPVPLLQQSSW